MKWMKAILFFSLSSSLYAEINIELPEAKASEIGSRIWHNECRKSIDGLLTWNAGENFASLGIGHFIWYPDNKSELYEEMFPLLIQFLEQKNITLPAWLNPKTPCPWKTRAEFLSAATDPKYKELKDLLSKTIPVQAQFMAERINIFFNKKIKTASEEEQKHIEKCINKLIKEPNGYYILIDYINFKGEGLQQNEHYSGVRWGLFQVLKNMNIESSQSPAQEFVNSAKSLLKRRVDHAPEGKDETKWLPGWFNRLDTYTLQIKESS